ncbi:MAG TPA: hypothetical protein VGC97_08710 [Pyrinomonadaceae bacterium]|jgi:hypothetical protein
MRDLTLAERAAIQKLTDQVAKTFKTRKPAAQTGNAAEMSFSGEARFSDTGKNSGKADFFAPEKAEAALNDIQRIVVKHSVKDSIKQYLTQRNSVIKRNKQRKAEADKLKRGGYQST